MPTPRRIELAAATGDGGWELIGDFATPAEALRAAEAYHASGDACILDDGSSRYGLTADPAGGDYETAIGVWPDAGAVVLS